MWWRFRVVPGSCRGVGRAPSPEVPRLARSGPGRSGDLVACGGGSGWSPVPAGSSGRRLRPRFLGWPGRVRGRPGDLVAWGGGSGWAPVRAGASVGRLRSKFLGWPGRVRGEAGGGGGWPWPPGGSRFCGGAVGVGVRQRVARAFRAGRCGRGVRAGLGSGGCRGGGGGMVPTMAGTGARYCGDAPRPFREKGHFLFPGRRPPNPDARIRGVRTATPPAGNTRRAPTGSARRAAEPRRGSLRQQRTPQRVCASGRRPTLV